MRRVTTNDFEQGRLGGIFSPALKDEIVKGFISISVASFLSIPQMSLSENLDSKIESRQEEVFLRFMDDLQLYASHERSVKFYSDRLCISPKAFYNEHIPLP